ncbi:MAG: hypothetical protein GY757_13970 [bacterium]|nr:hypothetical protein [bacterium]
MTKGFKKIAMITGLAVLLLLNVGCEDTETTTVIHPDGSCKRSVTVKSDSRDIFNEAYPVPRDSSWNVKKSIREGEQKEYTYFAEKNFKSAADLSDDYEKMNRGKVGGSISFELEKRYAWFFVYYTYKETYRELFPFRKVPRENHFTKEELEIMLEAMRNEKEAEKKYPADVLTRVEKKLLSWMGRSIFEEL